MPEPHLLIVAVDGLRASALGAYGNTSFSTPSLDQLAAASFLLDWCFAGSSELSSVYRSLWQSVHVLRPEAALRSRLSLPRWLRDRGYASTLVTDEARLVSLPGAAEFDECIELADAAHDRANSIAQTSLARLMAAACECLVQPVSSVGDDRDRPQLVWVHARGMYGPWDAPLELQESLLDEGDPEPYDEVEPPNVVVGEDDDPDIVFRYTCAYAAQVMVLDACIEGLTAAADAAWPDGNWLLVLLGVRGFPLGEHGRVGGVDKRLFAGQLHVPWLVRFPDGEGRLARSDGLASHLDLLPTLMEWFTGEAPTDGVDGMSILPLVRQPRPAWRDAVISAGPTGARSIRTPGWCLQCAPTDADLGGTGCASAPLAAAGTLAEPVAPALYVRPDDRLEANDVAKLCPDVVAGLSQVMAEVSGQIHQGGPVPSRMLPDEWQTSVD
jgi:hypothetical protein